MSNRILNRAFKRAVLLSAVFVFQLAHADPQAVRWTGKDDPNADLTHILQVIKTKTGIELTAANFTTLESRDLSRYRYLMLNQTAAGVPIEGDSLRIWTDLATGGTVQVEATVEAPKKASELGARLSGFNERFMETISSPETASQAISLARARIAENEDDRVAGDTKTRDVWRKGELVRIVTAQGRRGKHFVSISLQNGKVTDYRYEPFPQADIGDTADTDGELSVPAQIYPIYEEVEATGHMQSRIPANLTHLKTEVRDTDTDPFASLRNQHYLDSKSDAVLGETEPGRQQGYWSTAFLKRQAMQIRAALPLVPNTFKTTRGVILDGRYATVSIHPQAGTSFTGLKFKPGVSSEFKAYWITDNSTGASEYIPSGSLLGRPLTDLADAWNRPARRLPDHDPASYINDGFDEVQVYYAINTLVESLHQGGFTDPELSMRPFNAFLYDPDISMRDNAYYTDDTINFTTYSPKSINYARDNSTIWHELGHGIMDRLMGDFIQLADTGGLAEGMADFMAALVIEDMTDGKPFDGSNDFRIINHTAFYVTNEAHDDGEAYGGAMHDLMKASVARDGKAGLRKVSDLTMDTMRLTRNNPALTAGDWFGHMLFADELGSDVRKPGELGGLIRQALSGRNFSIEGKEPASYTLKNGVTELTSSAPGSRNSPIPVKLADTETASYTLTAQVKNTETYQFKFPVQIKVVFKTGPLQGAIHWVGDEKAPAVYTLKSPEDIAQIPVAAMGKCNYANREDGSCVDYAYVQVWNDGETSKPQAKRRFYLRVKPKPAGTPKAEAN